MPSHTHPLRSFGFSQVHLPALGFGAAPMGNLYQAIDDAQAGATIASALAAGIQYFDTAPHYGFGLSEQRLGAALSAKREQVILSTKVGRILVPTDSAAAVRHGFVDAPALEPVFDYSYDGVMRSFESSLRRLQTDYIDILLAHDLGPLTHGEQHSRYFRDFLTGGYRAMRELRAAGVVKAIGLGANEWQVCEQALAECDLDGFLLAGRYSLLEQGAAQSFLPACAQRGVSVVLGGAFNSGILASGVSGAGPFYYNYAPAPPAVIARVAQLEAQCQAFNLPLAAAALQFPLAHLQICSVIAGLASPAQVAKARHWMQLVIPPEFWQRLRELELISPLAPLPSASPLLS